MLETARIGIAQWLAVAGAPEENLETALRLVGELGRAGCDLIALPEYWVTGCSPATLKQDVAAAAEPLDGARCQALAHAARAAGSWLVAGTVPELTEEGVYNTAPLYSRTGELCARYRKCHLYKPDSEHEAVLAGDALVTYDTGELGVVGLSVCFDGDFPELARALRRRGAGIVVQPSAYEVGADRWWEVLYPANALANGQWWVLPNQCGAARDITFFGKSMIISPAGEVVRLGGRESADGAAEPELIIADVPLRAELERAEREQRMLWTDLRPEIVR